MAAAATHIVLANAVFDRLFSHFSKREFFVGTLFADIRYLGVIERDKTHFSEIILDDVLQEQDSFTAGLKFHSLVDRTREAFMVNRNVYQYCPDFKYITQSLKLLEDERYYPKCENWSEIISFFDTIAAGEQRFSVTEEDVQKWHVLLQKYFSNPPSDASRADFMSVVRMEPVIIAVNACVATLRNTTDVVQIVDDFYEQFPSLLK